MWRISTRRIAFTAIFAGIIFVSKVFIPTPFDKAVILPQATILTLASLILPRVGGTSTATVSGLLITLWRPSFAPLSLLISIYFGVLIDLFINVFRAKSLSGAVRLKRLLAATSAATALTGFVSYYLIVYLIEFMPPNPMIDAMILLGGIVNGFIAGLVASVIWRRIKHIV
ncbi:MAG: ECF transporter S component [Nitrososphaerales archaeon]